MVEQPPEVAEHLRAAVGGGIDSIYEVGPRQMKHLFGHGIALVSEEAFSLVTIWLGRIESGKPCD